MYRRLIVSKRVEDFTRHNGTYNTFHVCPGCTKDFICANVIRTVSKSINEILVETLQSRVFGKTQVSDRAESNKEVDFVVEISMVEGQS